MSGNYEALLDQWRFGSCSGLVDCAHKVVDAASPEDELDCSESSEPMQHWCEHCLWWATLEETARLRDALDVQGGILEGTQKSADQMREQLKAADDLAGAAEDAIGMIRGDCDHHDFRDALAAYRAARGTNG